MNVPWKFSTTVIPRQCPGERHCFRCSLLKFKILQNRHFAIFLWGLSLKFGLQYFKSASEIMGEGIWYSFQSDTPYVPVLSPFLRKHGWPFLFVNGFERWTIRNVQTMYDERSKTFAKSRLRFTKCHSIYNSFTKKM